MAEMKELWSECPSDIRWSTYTVCKKHFSKDDISRFESMVESAKSNKRVDWIPNLGDASYAEVKKLEGHEELVFRVHLGDLGISCEVEKAFLDAIVVSGLITDHIMGRVLYIRQDGEDFLNYNGTISFKDEYEDEDSVAGTGRGEHYFTNCTTNIFVKLPFDENGTNIQMEYGKKLDAMYYYGLEKILRDGLANKEKEDAEEYDIDDLFIDR